MAALLDLPAPDATAIRESAADWDHQRTQNWTGESTEDRVSEIPSVAPNRRIGTDAEVQQGERGHQYDGVRNDGEFGRTRTVAQTPESPPTNGDAIRLRSEAARDLCNRLDELIPLVGQIPFAAHLQLLKRDLSRCHDLLATHPSETNYLSIITLVESAIAQTKWKEYTARQMQDIRAAFDIGYRQPTVSLADYERCCREFRTAGLDANPRIDLDDFSNEQLTDDDEEPAPAHLS